VNSTYPTCTLHPGQVKPSPQQVQLNPSLVRIFVGKMYKMLFCTTLFVFLMSLFVQNVVLYGIKRFYYVIIMS